MSDPGVAGTDAFCHFEGAFEAEVGDVAATADTVDDEVVEVLEFFEFSFSYVVHVCAVGYVAESVTQNREGEVLSTDGDYLHSIYAERVFVDDMNVPFRSPWVAVLCEGI